MVEVPSDFIGPIRPEDTRAPSQFERTLEAGRQESERVMSIITGGGTSSRGGSSSRRSSSSASAQAQASFRAQQAAQQAAQQVAEQAARDAAATQTARDAAALATTRTQQALRRQVSPELQTASDIFQKKLRQQLADREAERIKIERARILEEGGRVEKKEFKDPETGEVTIVHTTTMGKKGNKIFETENLETGEKKVLTFERKQGRTRQTGGLFFKPIVTEIEQPKTIPSSILSTGEVQPITTSFFRRVADLPTKVIETVTGKKPREVFRFITGSQETDVTKPIGFGEAVVETTTVPMKGVSILAAGAAAGAKAITRKVAPEGIIVTVQPQETTFLEPQFGTITEEAPTGVIERTVKIGERQVQIFTPERVGQGVRAGGTIGATIIAPTLFAPGFVAEGTETALDPTKTPGQRVLGGVEAATGVFILGSKAVRFLRTPVVTRTPTRPIKTPQAVEVQKVVQVAGKPTTVSVFEIRGEISPPTIITRTTRGGQALDFFGRQIERAVRVGDRPVVSLRARPEIVKFIPARTFSVRTPEPVIGKAPFLVSEVKQGSRIATISRIAGTDRPISLSEFKQLSKIEQFALQRRAEQLVGQKVSLENVPRVLSSSKQRVSSFIESEKLLKVRPGARASEFELIPPGRRITRTVSVTEAEKITSIRKGTIGIELRDPIVTPTSKLPGRVIGRYQPNQARIYVQKDLSKELAKKVILHEKGHLVAGIENVVPRVKAGLTTKQLGKLQSTAKKHLTRVYGKEIPYNPSRYIDEYLADVYTGRLPVKRMDVLIGIKEDAPVDIIKAQTTFKDVTFPGARAAGRTPTLETTIVRIKPTPSPDDAIRFVAPAEITKTPFSKTFQAPAQVTEPLAARVPLPKPRPVTPTTTILEPTITPTVRVFPSIVGGIGGQRAESVFAGTGQFETTTPQVTSILSSSMIDAQEPRLEILQIQPQIEISKSRQRSRQVELIKQIEAQKSIQQPKQIELIKQIEAQKSIEAQKELLGLRSSQLFGTPSPQVPRTITTILPPPTIDTPAKKAVRQLAKQTKGDFEVFARIEGIDISIGKTKTKRKASKLLSKKLKRTLAASGFLEEDGRRLSAEETGLIDGEFRVGKLDVTRVVQKKTERLGTIQETSQIQFFRSSKKGGGNLFGSSSGRQKNSSFF